MARLQAKLRLSTPISQLKEHYTVVVIGSGYGGSIAASRLARARQSVCLLERGKEMQPGEYPDTLIEGMKETQVDAPVGHKGSRTALYDLRLNDDIHVFLGCGLGGTSLINANVALEAENRVFEQPEWPAQIQREAKQNQLEPYYRRAREMLKPEKYPVGRPGYPMPRKTSSHEVSAGALGEPFDLTPINVNFKDLPNGRNHVGVLQQPCVNCGDCVSGCNYGAKNTVLMNYLPDAYNHGAEIFTQTAVQWIEKQEDTGRWLIYLRLLDTGRERFSAPRMCITADVVILAAGTLGSTEILLRSRAKGLTLSNQLGRRFTGNADVLGFAYNCDRAINGIGRGNKDPDREYPVGPCITSVIDARNKPELNDGMVIQEGSTPGMISALLPTALFAAAAAVGKDTDRGFWDWARERIRSLTSLLFGSRRGAVENTQTYLVMAHDDYRGVMRLEQDRLRIDWKGVGGQEIFKTINEKVEAATKALGGTSIRNPLWTDLFRKDLVTVHPLGGCVMAEDATGGVVNHKGEAFSSNGGQAVHNGLYVADGAIVPRSLGVNPLLTICALAERICEHLAQDRGWPIEWAARQPDVPPGLEPPTGFRFTETMIGHISKTFDRNASADDLEHFKDAETNGREEGSHFQFILTMEGELDRFISEPEHEARTIGTVTAPLLSSSPLYVTQGRFNLFVPDPTRVETKEMRYAMKMATRGGKVLFFEGFKRIHDDPGMDVWSDTTTLYVTVYDGDTANSPILARGVLHIEPSDFTRQSRTMQITNARNTAERSEGLTKFGSHFMGSLFHTFGKSLADPMLFDPDAPPRERRPLRVGPPEVHMFQASDGETLRLARYRGGDKGPVILSHGLGVSSLIFAIDTIETNLLEYLYEHGYDTWLFDYRVSIELNSAEKPYNADHVAKLDYPAAVDKVRQLTGSDTVQFVAHCYGATTFTMAMLAGLQGVRSAVLSQICTDVKAGSLTRIKSALYLPNVLDILGIDSLTAYVDRNRNWFDRLYDRSLEFYPIEAEERANSPVHRRITFMYGTLYELDQLNDATFKALHEMFGVANIASMEHLCAMVRANRVVAANGNDEYLSNIKRLDLPLTIIHGEENACFLPQSTELALERLRQANRPENYQRHVIPKYGHIDCIFGKNAAKDVYPYILEHLERTH